ncbi:RNA polymerase sigma factor [Novosphingobium pentaromativorans]|uniref:RNA polymerase sigma factor n=1 Tax=Novosphingobium pentaromativorans TaxID=205844 RepID=UPI00051F8428|nr:RNA polymerase sigma factor [Novosphingobium pentaromativorans]AIT79187.1 hypothetical protein JI59_04955 [Novosphingobium pentaromativorans US6-1]
MRGETLEDEKRIVASARIGGRAAFDQLARHYAPGLLVLAERMMGNSADGEDAVQDALAAAWLALRQFDQKRPLGPWLATITMNKCRDGLRRRRLALFFHIDGSEQDYVIPDDRPGQERELVSRQELARVKREISLLPQKFREPFVLVALESYSQAEAAQILGISEKAVETRIYRARNSLKEKFEKF